MEQQNALTKRVSNDELRTRLRLQLGQFGNVARILDRLQGQKQIILLSEGFDATVVTGRDLASQENRDDDEAVLSGEAYSVDTSARFGNTSSNNDIQQMAELFRRSDVVLHAIDIKGIRAGSEASEGATKSKASEGLNLITRPTGGTVFKNANDMTENFARMLRQQETIYVLGFAARSSDKPGKFHNLKVKVNNMPRGTRVSSRAGYYEPTSKISDLERALTLAEMLMTDAPMKDVDLSVTATTLPGPGG
jgi:VWFA-related protein